MRLRITAVSDIGRLRGNNEDMVLVGRELLRDGTLRTSVELDGERRIFLIAVADGLGGENAGEVASRRVLEEFRDRIYTLERGLDREGLRIEISTLALNVHRRIVREGMANAERMGMATTLVGLLYYEGSLLLINAGDSRLYRFRNGVLVQLSTDHSLRDLLGDSQIPRNIVSNCFGGGNVFYVDVEEAARDVRAGDLFLLCSDGLTDMLPDAEIEKILNEDGYEENLLAMAKERGGRDNVSYVLAQVII